MAELEFEHRPLWLGKLLFPLYFSDFVLLLLLQVLSSTGFLFSVMKVAIDINSKGTPTDLIPRHQFHMSKSVLLTLITIISTETFSSSPGHIHSCLDVYD